MQINKNSPNTIYSDVSTEVDRILKTLDKSTKDKKISEQTQNAQKILTDLKTEIDKNIAALKKHSEWDVFTIAFYGETNAGKSTIIETLRIMLGEQTKLKTQQQFKALQEKHGITDESFEILRHSTLQNEELLAKLERELSDIIQQHESQENEFNEEIRHLQFLTLEKKKAASFWRKLLNLFIKLPEEKAAKTTTKKLKAIKAAKHKEVSRFEQQQLRIKKQNTVAEKKLNDLESKLKHLEAYADGGIIGDGRNDFTRETSKYTFELGNQKFALLDVPGIEGNEALVINNIETAVTNAHAVFYVTSKAAAPQKGSDNNKGTIDKIKEHLGDQTEVWTIYNKPINNPRQLTHQLINDDEQASLDDLDCKMREQLGENYKKTFPLSAQPAFLSIADCLVPGLKNAKNKAKFLSAFSHEELLSKSNVSQFHELLTNNLVNDVKNKIKHSNFKKAENVINKTITEVDEIQTSTFELSQTLKTDADSACEQLELALGGLKNRLESQGEKSIRNFSNTVRNKIYTQIEKDISNESFENKFKSYIEEEQLSLQKNLPLVIQNELKKFESEIADIIEKYQQYAQELMTAYSKIQAGNLDTKFDLKIDIDNGLKWQNLIAPLVGGGLMFWNPAGWVVLALSVTTILISIGKAVISFFSSSYRMSQQRRSADENLKEITDQMRIEMHRSLDDAFPTLITKVDEIKLALEEPVKQIKEILTTLEQSKQKLTTLSKTIETEGIK